ncbi:MAG TPA: hypothetical protein VN895_00420 [Candidatus Acidoferrum sp.]|nr:hypothetical protein [Candidatus Acidoferrum sp.]
MTDRVIRYLYGPKNIVGSLLALVGLVLVFTGILGALWPVIVVGLYLIGVLLTPGIKDINLTTGFDPNNVKLALDTQVRVITGKVPPEVMAKVLKIRQTILGILPRSGNLAPGSPELFVIERTATNYLPTSLEAYLNLPKAYAARHQVQDGKTPKEILLDQLTLLENKMNEVVDDVHRNDSDRLLAHGRFLEERFGRSPLSLKPPASSGE